MLPGVKREARWPWWHARRCRPGAMGGAPSVKEGLASSCLLFLATQRRGQLVRLRQQVAPGAQQHNHPPHVLHAAEQLVRIAAHNADLQQQQQQQQQQGSSGDAAGQGRLSERVARLALTKQYRVLLSQPASQPAS